MSATIKAQLTDEALELAKLAQLIKGFNPGKEVAAHEMLNQLLNKVTLRSQPMLAYYTCAKRADNLIKFVEEVDDEHLDDELRQDAKAAIKSIQTIFLHERINTNWAHCLREFVKQEYIVAIKYLSRTVRAHRPLRVINNEEIEIICKSLEEARNNIADSSSIPPWAKSILGEGISAAEFRLSNLAYFGHDEVLSSFAELEAVSVNIARNYEKENGSKINIMPIIVAVMLAKDLFTAPVEITQAALSYSSWKQSAIDFVNKDSPSEPKLLPPPQKAKGKAVQKREVGRKIPTVPKSAAKGSVSKTTK